MNWTHIPKRVYQYLDSIDFRSNFKAVPNHLIGTVYALTGGRIVKTYWYNGKLNFGYTIGHLLLRRHKFYPYYTASGGQIVLVGSILESLEDTYSGMIMGCGFISEKTMKTFPNAKILALRGRLTLKKLGRQEDGIVLGDPGLIAADFISKRTKKDFPIGIIPHYADRKRAEIRQLRERFKGQIAFIDVRRDVRAVLKDIDRCEKILSTSLHGCIVSDSLGIPNAWFQLSILTGNRFKFDDYYCIYDIQREPRHITGQETMEQLKEMVVSVPSTVIDRQNDLRRLFDRLDYFLAN
jgi:pyruvyltransferase